jgi:hypothetical protein
MNSTSRFFSAVRYIAIGLAFFSALSAACRAAEPDLLTSSVGSADAPLISNVTVHTSGRQNIRFEWSAFGPGSDGGPAVLFGLSTPRDDHADPRYSPLMVLCDLSSGKLSPFYRAAVDSGKAGRKRPPGDFSATTSIWCWGTPVGAVGVESSFLIGARGLAEEKVAPALIRFDPERGIYEELIALPADPCALFLFEGEPHVLLADGKIFKRDALTGEILEVVRLKKSFRYVREIRHAGDGAFHAVTGRGPYQLVRFSLNGDASVLRLTDGTVEDLELVDSAEKQLLRAVLYEPGKGAFRAGYEVSGSNARRLPEVPECIRRDPQSGMLVRFDLDHIPPRIRVAGDGPESPWHQILVDRAFHDGLKSIRASRDGRYIYTGGWPVAWFCRFDTKTGEFRKIARHYNIYEMQLWNDEIWMTAYYGQKLLRYRPDQPWTFDTTRHIMKKRFPHTSSPWGDKDVSNPRLVCRFRYFKKLYARRTSGLVIDRRDTAWVGSRTPPVRYISNHGSRCSGAINWYDPHKEMIGQIREPFVHYALRDMCSAGPDHVLGVSQLYSIPYEPLPENAPRGKISLVNIDSREVVQQIAPTGASMTYAEEAEPGKVVIFSRASKTVSDKPHRGIMLVYDVNEKRVTHMVLMPLYIGWGEYNVLYFERGPDRKIYFYGRDGNGTALFRFDSATCKVEPVLRHKMITESASYNNNGAYFAFAGDRVYFCARELVSVPIETVVGGK